MKSHISNTILAACFLVFSLQSQADTRGLIVSTSLQQIPQSSCLTRVKAEAEAYRLALKSAQDYCRGSGFGWRASSVKELGNLECQRCTGVGYSCGYSKTSLECRKAEPKLSWSGWLSDNP
jgi:hypothetical protein